MGKAKKLAMIGGIDASKIKEEALDEALDELGLEIQDTEAPDVVRKVSALKDYFETREQEDLSGPCTVCGAISLASLVRCPFCGTSDDEEKSAALVPPNPTILQYPNKSADLDKAVKEIKELQSGAAACAWILAKKVTEVCKSQVWKARVSSDGKVAYRTFEEFAKTEVNMTPRYAQELLKLYNRFTEEQFKEYGPTKLRLVLAAPKEMDAEILEKLKGGASKRELERSLGREGRDLNVQNNDARTKEGKAKKPEPAGANYERKTITIAAIEGKKTFPLYCREKKNGEKVPARDLNDMPWGTVEMTNDVEIQFAIWKDPNGELQGRIIVSRMKD